jgi:ribosome recycling factor
MSYNINQHKEEFKKVEQWLSGEYAGIHTGRATPLVLDKITIEAYGVFQPIQNVGSISVEDAKTLRVIPWDKSHVKEIEKSIQASNLGLSVSTDDQGLRIIFPALTTENRQKLVKVLKEKHEDARIRVRKVREDISGLIKNAELSEDESFRAKDDLQKLVDETNGGLDSIFEKKENEVMSS